MYASTGEIQGGRFRGKIFLSVEDGTYTFLGYLDGEGEVAPLLGGARLFDSHEEAIDFARQRGYTVEEDRG